MNIAKVVMYLLKSSICAAFFIHAFTIAYDLIFPTETVLKFEQRNLDVVDFPIVFKVCITPAFNKSKLQELGYRRVWDYFTGTSRYARYKIYGWSGHMKNGSTISSAKGL